VGLQHLSDEQRIVPVQPGPDDAAVHRRNCLAPSIYDILFATFENLCEYQADVRFRPGACARTLEMLLALNVSELRWRVQADGEYLAA
jgi:hypothetical protein